MSGVQNGPIPTRLTLLSDLPIFAPGSKVRFLGCVTHYSTKSAVLTLEHNHPPGNSLKALVDINLLIQNMKSVETRIGEWVNVMGYVKEPDRQTLATFKDIRIQAIVLWSSGPLNLQKYEQSLDSQIPEEQDGSERKP